MPFLSLARSLLIVCFFMVAGCDSGPTFQPLGSGARVLAFGDSVTHGTGAGQGEDYPTLLAHHSGWEVINAGIPGDTALKARERIHAALQQYDPDLVIVELGGNDFLRRRPAPEVKEDLRSIIQAVKQQGATPVLVAVPQFSVFGASLGSLSDSPIYAELAEEEQVLLIPKVFSQVLSRNELKTDPIHPNTQGYQVLAEGLIEGLAKAGLL